MSLAEFMIEQSRINRAEDFANNELPQLLQADPTGRAATLRYMQVRPDLVTEGLASLTDPKAQQARVQQSALSALLGGSAPQPQQRPAMPQGVPMDADNALAQYADMQQPQQRPQITGSNAIANAYGTSSNVPDFIAKIDANPAILPALPEKFQSAYMDYKINPNKYANEALDTQKKQQDITTEQQKAELAKKAMADKKASALQELDRLIGTDGKSGLIGEAYNMTDEGKIYWPIGATVGRAGFIARNTGSPKAGDYENILNTIKSNSALSKLMEMKQMSPTGSSGLGAVTKEELQLLTSNIRGIEPNQSEDQMKKNLLAMRDELKVIRDRVSGGEAVAQDTPALPGMQEGRMYKKGNTMAVVKDGKLVPIQ